MADVVSAIMKATRAKNPGSILKRKVNGNYPAIPYVAA